MATVKKASSAGKAAKKSATSAKKSPVKKTAAPAAKPAPVKKTTKKAAPAAPKKAAPKKAAAAAKKAAPAPKKAAPAPKKATKAAKAPPEPVVHKPITAPVAKGLVNKPTPAKKAIVRKSGKVVLDKFQLKQRDQLKEERETYLQQAQSLRAEADQIALEAEPGDIQFDDESGEGGTMAIDRERDLALASQAMGIIDEIDHALRKLEMGTYGFCENCGQPILKARLEALPYARLCISCKSGGLSRR